MAERMINMIFEDDELIPRRPRIISERTNFFNILDDKDFEMRFRLSKRSTLEVLESIEGNLEFPSDRLVLTFLAYAKIYKTFFVQEIIFLFYFHCNLTTSLYWYNGMIMKLVLGTMLLLQLISYYALCATMLREVYF